MPILVTGFEPFGGMSHNPSQALLEHLPPAVGGVPVATACLPVDSRQVEARLRELYARHRPRVALHLGLAANRAQISLERLAVNLLDFDIPDNAGHRAVDQPVRPGAPLALLTRLPVRAIRQRLHQEGIPAQLSLSAGAYLCNQVMYLALTLLPQEAACGFIHLPPDETLALQRGGAYVPLATQARAVVLALEACLAEHPAEPSSP